MTSITEIEVKVRELAERYPDAKYKPHAEILGETSGNTCLYTYGEIENGPSEPGCIIGHALSYFYSRQELRRCDHDGIGSISSVLERLMEDDDVADTTWLNEVQGLQDTGHTWQQAVTYADLPG